MLRGLFEVSLPLADTALAPLGAVLQIRGELAEVPLPPQAFDVNLRLAPPRALWATFQFTVDRRTPPAGETLLAMMSAPYNAGLPGCNLNALNCASELLVRCLYWDGHGRRHGTLQQEREFFMELARWRATLWNSIVTAEDVRKLLERNVSGPWDSVTGKHRGDEGRWRINVLVRSGQYLDHGGGTYGDRLWLFQEITPRDWDLIQDAAERLGKAVRESRKENGR